MKSQALFTFHIIQGEKAKKNCFSLNTYFFQRKRKQIYSKYWPSLTIHTLFPSLAQSVDTTPKEIHVKSNVSRNLFEQDVIYIIYDKRPILHNIEEKARILLISWVRFCTLEVHC